MVASMIKASGAGDGESNCMKWPSRPQDLPEKKTVGNDKGKEISAAWKAGMHRVNLFADKAKAQDQDDQQAQHTDAAHLFDKEIQTKNQRPT
jgi:hypothetical protein